MSIHGLLEGLPSVRLEQEGVWQFRFNPHERTHGSRYSLAALLFCLIAAIPAMAHPLGNDGIMHFSVLRLAEDRIEVDLILDVAEVESEILRREEIDADRDGRDSAAEQEAWLERKTADFARQIHVHLGDLPLALRYRGGPAETSDRSRRRHRVLLKMPGTAGMPTYRMAIPYVAEWPAPLTAGQHTLSYEDATFPGIPGLARILLERPSLLTRVPAESLDLASLNAGIIPDSIQSTLERQGLRLSPDDRLSVDRPGTQWRLDRPPTSFVLEMIGEDVCLFRWPRVIVEDPRPPFWDECEINPFLYEQYDPGDLPDERRTTLSFRLEPSQAGRPMSAPASNAAGPAESYPTIDYHSILSDPRNDPAKQGKPQREAARLVALLQQPWGWTIFVTVTAFCFAWGAAHALMPGHAKTLVAAYLISSSGTAWHAVLLAVVVTITHTALVVVLGLVIWFYQRTHPQIGPAVQLWLGTIAGLLVAGMGLSLLYRALVGGHHHDYSHGHHHHHHPHGHHHDHASPHHEDHEHLHDHSHPHANEHHDHGQPNRVTGRVLLLLGITGGLVPCPTATIIMLLGIGANVVIGALYAVLVFSLGLALTLMSVGFLALYSRRFAARLMTAPDHNGAPSAHGHWLLNRLIPALSGLGVLALGVALTAHYIHLLRTGRALFAWLQ